MTKVTKVEQRKWETVLQENLFWHELLVNMLQHREYFKVISNSMALFLLGSDIANWWMSPFECTLLEDLTVQYLALLWAVPLVRHSSITA